MRINLRTGQELKFQAALHGAKIEAQGTQSFRHLSTEKEALMKGASTAAMERLRRKAEERGAQQ